MRDVIRSTRSQFVMRDVIRSTRSQFVMRDVIRSTCLSSQFVMRDVIKGPQRPSAALRGTHTCFSSAFRRRTGAHLMRDAISMQYQHAISSAFRRRTGAHQGKPIASQMSSLRRTTRSSSHVFSVRYPRTSCGEVMAP
jgi:hypothetical protein